MASATMPDPASVLSSQVSATVVTEDIEKPPLDNRSYRCVMLKNGLEVLLIHDPDTDMACVSLDNKSGTLSDPIDMQGLAHAVEHVTCFMGSKDFPAENEFSKCVRNNGGSYDAYTNLTSTCFFCNITGKPANGEEPTATNPSPLYLALAILSAFFKSPLFSPDTLDPELKVINLEFEGLRQEDVWRLWQLEKEFSNPKHPYCKFPIGTFENLKKAPEAAGIDVRDKIIEHYDHHFSANRMKLVILSRESLDVLQKWAIELFSPIVNKSLPDNRYTEHVPFRPSDLEIQWFARPIADRRELKLAFPFIDEEGLYESAPSKYISHIISHGGSGSIAFYLHSKGWATLVTAQSCAICPGSPGTFEITVELTEEGLQNYKEIGIICFMYLAFLRQSTPQQWIFEEMKSMSDVNFKFCQDISNTAFTNGLCSLMQTPLPRKWLRSDNSCPRRFDADGVSQALELLRPELLRLSVVSYNFPGDEDKKEGWKKEKWFGTEYKMNKIPDDLMAKLKAAASIPAESIPQAFHLPHKNQFIPTKLEVEKKEDTEPATAPKLLRNDDLCRIWYKNDGNCLVPKANVIVSLKTHIVNATAENFVKAELLVALLVDQLAEPMYNATFAGLEFHPLVKNRGLAFHVSGYNENLPVYLELIAAAIRDLEIHPDRFKIAVEQLTRGYRNRQRVPPCERKDYMRALNTECFYLPDELGAILPDITVDAVRTFKKQILGEMYPEVYVDGDMTRADAIKVMDLLLTTFNPKILPWNQWPISRSLTLPPGSDFVYKKSLKDPADFNHYMSTCFITGVFGNRRIQARTLLTSQLIDELFFNQLRTVEQLGYSVLSGTPDFKGTCGVIFAIQSEREPEYLNRRVEAVLIQFCRTLAEMSDKEFEGHKRSAITRVQNSAKHFYWDQIYEENFDFEQEQLDAAEVKLLSKVEMVDFCYKNLHPSSSSRARLSVHLYSRGAAERDRKIVEALDTAGFVNVPEEDRQSLELVKAHLQATHKPTEADLDNVLALIKDLGLVETVPVLEGDAEPVADGGGKCTVANVQVIEDIRLFQSGRMATPAVKQLSEFEDIDSKL